MIFASTSKVFLKEKLTSPETTGKISFLEVRSALSPLRSETNADMQFLGWLQGNAVWEREAVSLNCKKKASGMFVRFRLRAKGRMHFCIPVDLGTPHQRVLWDAKSLHGQEKKKKSLHQWEIPCRLLSTGLFLSWEYSESRKDYGKINYVIMHLLMVPARERTLDETDHWFDSMYLSQRLLQSNASSPNILP